MDQNRDNLKRRCWGRLANLHRCGRKGDWRFFCEDHERQWIIFIFFLIFTVGGGTASIYAVFFDHPETSVQREYQDVDLSGRWSGFHGVYYLIEQQGDQIKWEAYGSDNMLWSEGIGKIAGRQIKVEYDGREGPGEGLFEISSDGRRISGNVTARHTGRRASLALSR